MFSSVFISSRSLINALASAETTSTVIHDSSFSSPGVSTEKGSSARAAAGKSDPPGMYSTVASSTPSMRPRPFSFCH